MLDPFTIIGTAASIASIVEVLARSIQAISALRQEFNDADFTLLNLIGQLTALKAALTKIKQWTDSNLDESHHQLVMDLDVSVACCKVLVSKIGSNLSELQRGRQDMTLDLSAKFKLFFGRKEMDHLQKLIERQTNALVLLLTACNCESIAEQKILLEKTSTRKVLKNVETDSASLIGLRDTASLLSRWTYSSSKLSMIFTFDRELFVSKVYERAFRGSLKESIRRQQSDTRLNEVGRNELIDKTLLHDRQKLQREVRILALGSGNSDKSSWLKQLQLFAPESLTSKERKAWKNAILQTIINDFLMVIGIMEVEEVDCEDVESLHYKSLLNDESDIENEDPIPMKYLNCFTSLWADRGVQLAMLRGNEYQIHDRLAYFLEDVSRLFKIDYLPSNQDIMRAKRKTSGIQEIQFCRGDLSYHVMDMGGQRSERKKWIHLFDSVHILLFFVSLSGYDQCLVEDPNGNQMNEAQILFESIANSSHFKRATLVLIFTKNDIFREKVQSGQSPIGRYFPAFKGSPADVEAGRAYFAESFRRLNRDPSKEMGVHFVNTTDTNHVEILQNNVHRMFVERNLISLIL